MPITKVSMAIISNWRPPLVVGTTRQLPMARSLMMLQGLFKIIYWFVKT